MTCITPKNGMYLTSKDFPAWHEEFASLLPERKEKTDELLVKTVTFVVTEQCSLRCTYCYQHDKKNRRMTKEVARKAVDFLLAGNGLNGYLDIKNSQGIVLEFIGGEPLLEIDLIDWTVDYFKFKAFQRNHPWATNYMISLSSNGVMYNDERVQQFLKKNKGRVYLGISIDGDKQLHDACRVFPDGRGSYDIVAEAVKEHINNYGLRQSKVTIAPDNLPYLFQAIKHLWDMGLPGIFANTVFEEGWTIEHARLFYTKLKKLADYLLEDQNYTKYQTSLFDESIGSYLIDTKNFCGGNGEMLAIGTDGKCYPCIRYMQYCMSTNRKEKSIGDISGGIHSEDKDVWLKHLHLIDMLTQSTKECLNCEVASGCAVCPGYQYDIFGDPNKRATYICIMHKARVLANVYFWNKLYEKLCINRIFPLNLPRSAALDIISGDEYTVLESLTKRGEWSW